MSQGKKTLSLDDIIGKLEESDDSDYDIQQLLEDESQVCHLHHHHCQHHPHNLHHDDHHHH